MSVEELDFIFPFIVFGYGAVMTLIFQFGLVRLANGRIPEPLLAQIRAHRVLGQLCLVVGAIWSLQHLLL